MLMPSCPNVIEILLVEDNPHDAELAIRALKKNNLENKVAWVKDGAEALDFIFARGAYSGRDIDCAPKLIIIRPETANEVDLPISVYFNEAAAFRSPHVFEVSHAF